MNRQHQRRRERCEEQISSREVPPFVVGVAPAQREHRVNGLPDGADFLAVPQHRDVRNQPDEKEGARDREIGEDRKDVPHQRALELRPDVSPVRIRNQPEEFPRPSEVQNRKQRRGHDREHGHRFGAAVNRGAETGAEQIQNRRDQGTGVSDTNPKDESDDVHSPHHRRVVASDAQAAVDLVHPGADADDEEEDRDAESDEPEESRPKCPADLAIDLLVVSDRRQLSVRRGDVRTAWLVARRYRPGDGRHATPSPLAWDASPSSGKRPRYTCSAPRRRDKLARLSPTG